MEERRVELGLRWTDVAERAEMSTEGLRAIRAGETNPLPLTRASIEGALEWERGSVNAILHGEDPLPAVRRSTEAPRPTLSADGGDREAILAEMRALAMRLPDGVREDELDHIATVERRLQREAAQRGA